MASLVNYIYHSRLVWFQLSASQNVLLWAFAKTTHTTKDVESDRKVNFGCHTIVQMYSVRPGKDFSQFGCNVICRCSVCWLSQIPFEYQRHLSISEFRQGQNTENSDKKLS